MAITAIPPLAEALPEMRDGLTLLVVGTIFASFLIPAAVLLFLFVPYSMLKSPLFIFNVCAIALGLVQQGLYIYVIIKTTTIQAVATGLVILITAMEFLLPVCVQAILIIRLVAVYPPGSLPVKTTIAIYTPIVAFKIARLTNAGMTLQNLLSTLPEDAGVIIAAQAVWDSKYVKIEWFLQLFDDMIVSGLFIYKLYTHMKDTSTIRNDSNHSRSNSYSWHQRFRTLFYIWTSNFIFPIIFNIAEIAVIFYDTNFLHGLVVVTINCYVTILGVLLATIWAKGSEHGKLPGLGDSEGSKSSTMSASIAFAHPPLQSHMSENDIGSREDRSTPFINSKHRQKRTKAPDWISQSTVEEEYQEKRLSASSREQPTLDEVAAVSNSPEHIATNLPITVYEEASSPESYHTAADIV